ncbi:hypothetical protein PBCVNW6652_639L [Paramecium bursaria Chlorella virus NW665.2]|nr:hypothetical protein PBCVNW6652_639L [Paramecium bursaria Chlorella virus NW665.2]
MSTSKTVKSMAPIRPLPISQSKPAPAPVKPAPAPVPKPAPKPTPAPVPKPAPAPVPKPAPKPAPAPVPKPAPAPVPKPAPAPVPKPAPAPVPKPAPAPVPVPVPKPAPAPVPKPAPKKPATPSQDDIAVQGAVMKIVSPTQVRIKFTDPDGVFRTPVITKTNHGLVNGSDVVVLLKSTPPYTFVSLYQENAKNEPSPVGPQLLPSIEIKGQAPMLPIADIPNQFEQQSKLTYPISPSIDNGPMVIPGYVKTSCIMEAIQKCSKQDDDTQSNFSLSSGTKMPLPLPMAPRETFTDLFLNQNYLNKIDDKNVNYDTGMDYTVDFEVSTTPFEQARMVPENQLGNAIPRTPDFKVPLNPIAAETEQIVPDDYPNVIKSRADTPIVDIIAKSSMNVGASVVNYAKVAGSWLSQYYSGMAKNDAISTVFKDNAKMISILIAVAVGSFIMNAGVSAIVVGIILLLAMKNVSQVF